MSSTKKRERSDDSGGSDDEPTPKRRKIRDSMGYEMRYCHVCEMLFYNILVIDGVNMCQDCADTDMLAILTPRQLSLKKRLTELSQDWAYGAPFDVIHREMQETEPRDGITATQLSSDLDYLMIEGYIYSTHDDYHFRAVL